MVHSFSFVRGTTNMKKENNMNVKKKKIVQTFFLNTKIYFLFNFDIWNLFLFLVGCQIFAKSDGDPIENFENRDEADAEGDSSYPTNIGGKIKPGHLFRS